MNLIFSWPNALTPQSHLVLGTHSIFNVFICFCFYRFLCLYVFMFSVVTSGTDTSRILPEPALEKGNKLIARQRLNADLDEQIRMKQDTKLRLKVSHRE